MSVKSYTQKTINAKKIKPVRMRKSLKEVNSEKREETTKKQEQAAKQAFLQKLRELKSEVVSNGETISAVQRSAEVASSVLETIKTQ